LAEGEKRVPSAGRKGHYNAVTIFNYLSLQKSIFFLRRSENQAQKQAQCRTGFKTFSFFGGTGLPSTVPIKTSASFTLKSSFKAPIGYDRFHSYTQLKFQLMYEKNVKSLSV
jgi:hypothetical protein